MIPARKSALVEQWFRGYTRSYLRRSFHRVLLSGERPPDPSTPLIICSNHSSWWDMLAAFWLLSDYLGWDGFGPMDQRQLARYPVLRRIGVFGVDRESLQGGRDFLNYGASLLEQPGRVLWITAQGELASNDVRPVRFYSGAACLATLAAERSGTCALLSIAVDYEFWDEKRPELFIRFGTPRTVVAGAIGSRRSLLRSMELDLETEMDALASLRRRRDPGLFETALSGNSGVSPVYDLMRRISARWKREPNGLDHGDLKSPPRWDRPWRRGGRRWLPRSAPPARPAPEREKNRARLSSRHNAPAGAHGPSRAPQPPRAATPAPRR